MTSDLVPVANLAAVEALDPTAREAAVTKMLSEARSWLAHAVEITGPAEIANFKAYLATVEESTRQLNLSKEIQRDAQEMVRRADRGLALAVRKGQENGEVRTEAEGHQIGGRGRHQLNSDEMELKPRPLDYFGTDRVRSDSYLLADDVSDEQFEEALEEAKAEGNLSRANVIRKVKPERVPKPSSRHELLRGLRHIDGNRVVEQTILQSGLSESLAEQIDYAALDRDRLEGWVISLSDAIRSLTTLKKNLQKEMTRE